MNKPTKAQLTFLIAVSQNSVTALAHTRLSTSSGKSPFIIKKVFIADALQHHSKIATAAICLENNWIHLTRARDICAVTLTETGHKLIEGIK